jgi:hypothetical protein
MIDGLFIIEGARLKFKISKLFVIIYFIIGIALLLSNIILLAFKVYHWIFGIILLIYLVGFISLVLRKDSNTVKKILSWCFQTVLVLYLGTLLLNEFWKVPVNMDYFLGFVIVLGVFSVLFPANVKEKKVTKTWVDAVLIWVLAIGGGILIFIKTKQLGWLSYAISSVSTVLMITMGYLIYEEEDN